MPIPGSGRTAGPTAAGHDHAATGLDLEPLLATVVATLVEEGVDVGHVDLFLIDVEEMTELNRAHMGGTGPTDVLAFPLDDPDDPDDRLLDGSGVAELVAHIGDLVICVEVAEAQAPDHAGSLPAELTLLAVHGVLHLLGHDHAEPEETALMQARERHHLARHGFEHPIPAPPTGSEPL